MVGRSEKNRKPLDYLDTRGLSSLTVSSRRRHASPRLTPLAVATDPSLKTSTTSSQRRARARYLDDDDDVIHFLLMGRTCCCCCCGVGGATGAGAGAGGALRAASSTNCRPLARPARRPRCVDSDGISRALCCLLVRECRGRRVFVFSLVSCLCDTVFLFQEKKQQARTVSSLSQTTQQPRSLVAWAAATGRRIRGGNAGGVCRARVCARELVRVLCLLCGLEQSESDDDSSASLWNSRGKELDDPCNPLTIDPKIGHSGFRVG